MSGAIVVIGAQWGDEGKGKIVDLLTGALRWWRGSRAGTTPAIPSSSAASARCCTWSLPG